MSLYESFFIAFILKARKMLYLCLTSSLAGELKPCKMSSEACDRLKTQPVVTSDGQ